MPQRTLKNQIQIFPKGSQAQPRYFGISVEKDPLNRSLQAEIINSLKQTTCGRVSRKDKQRKEQNA